MNLATLRSNHQTQLIVVRPLTKVDVIPEACDFPPLEDDPKCLHLTARKFITSKADMDGTFVATFEYEAFKARIRTEFAAQKEQQEAMTTNQDAMDLKINARIVKLDEMWNL